MCSYYSKLQWSDICKTADQYVQNNTFGTNYGFKWAISGSCVIFSTLRKSWKQALNCKVIQVARRSILAMCSRNKISLASRASRWTKSGRQEKPRDFSVNNLAAQAPDAAKDSRYPEKAREDPDRRSCLCNIREHEGEGRRQTAINKARNPMVMRQSAAVTVATT